MRDYINQLKEKRICSECVCEPYLQSQIEEFGAEAECDYCLRTGPTFTIEDMANRVEVAFQQHYERTETQADGYEWALQRKASRTGADTAKIPYSRSGIWPRLMSCRPLTSKRCLPTATPSAILAPRLKWSMSLSVTLTMLPKNMMMRSGMRSGASLSMPSKRRPASSARRPQRLSRISSEPSQG